jgi:hypothetical protein
LLSFTSLADALLGVMKESGQRLNALTICSHAYLGLIYFTTTTCELCHPQLQIMPHCCSPPISAHLYLAVMLESIWPKLPGFLEVGDIG